MAQESFFTLQINSCSRKQILQVCEKKSRCLVFHFSWSWQSVGYDLLFYLSLSSTSTTGWLAGCALRGAVKCRNGNSGRHGSDYSGPPGRDREFSEV
jgi:hypothetical protein